MSSLYRTPPWGKTDQPDFINAAAEIRTSLEPRALLALCLDAEHELKRVRQERWGPRIVDIDILAFGDRVIREAGLEIPHPRILERAFVLVPLAEIAPELEILGSSVSGHLQASTGRGSSSCRPAATGGNRSRFPSRSRGEADCADDFAP